MYTLRVMQKGLLEKLKSPNLTRSVKSSQKPGKHYFKKRERRFFAPVHRVSIFLRVRVPQCQRFFSGRQPTADRRGPTYRLYTSFFKFLCQTLAVPGNAVKDFQECSRVRKTGTAHASTFTSIFDLRRRRRVGRPPSGERGYGTFQSLSVFRSR